MLIIIILSSSDGRRFLRQIWRGLGSKRWGDIGQVMRSRSGPGVGELILPQDFWELARNGFLTVESCSLAVSYRLSVPISLPSVVLMLVSGGSASLPF